MIRLLCVWVPKMMSKTWSTVYRALKCGVHIFSHTIKNMRIDVCVCVCICVIVFVGVCVWVR